MHQGPTQGYTYTQCPVHSAVQCSAPPRFTAHIGNHGITAQVTCHCVMPCWLGLQRRQECQQWRLTTTLSALAIL
jgi:hypothetical protein